MNVCSVCTGGWAGERAEGTGLWVQVAGAWALNHGPLEGTGSRTRCGLCAGVRDGGCPWGRDSCPSQRGWEGTSLITWACVSVCVDGVQGAGGCQGQTLPRPRQPGSPRRLPPALLKGSPTSPLPSRKSSLEITPDSPAGQTLLQVGLPGTSYSFGRHVVSPIATVTLDERGDTGIFRRRLCS